MNFFYTMKEIILKVAKNRSNMKKFDSKILKSRISGFLNDYRKTLFKLSSLCIEKIGESFENNLEEDDKKFTGLLDSLIKTFNEKSYIKEEEENLEVMHIDIFNYLKFGKFGFRLAASNMTVTVRLANFLKKKAGYLDKISKKKKT